MTAVMAYFRVEGVALWPEYNERRKSRKKSVKNFEGQEKRKGFRTWHD